jgi:hypothetical protein
MKYKFLIFIIALNLLGCSKRSELETSFSTYANRMANVLGVEPVTLIKPTLSSPDNKLPRKADIDAPHNETISLITLAKLNQCGLGPLIAEKNTSLGKAQLPSTRFIWEVRFHRQLTYCTKQPLDQVTKALVGDILKAKINSWDNQWAYFIQTSDAIRQSFQQNVSLINGENDGIADTMASLKYLKSLQKVHFQHEESQPLDNLENHLKNLGNYKLPAATWRTQQYVAKNLNLLTDWLNQNINTETCTRDMRFNTKAKYLRNVFELFFVEEIQPTTSILNNYLYKINPAVSELVQSDVINKQFSNWVMANANEEQYKTSMQQHIAFWQKFFKACNFSPGK